MLVSQLRRHGAFVALLVLASCAYFALTWSGQLASFGGDSSVYLLTARHYAPYVPADPVLAEFAAGSQFPPLFPLLLAASYGAADLHLAHAAVTSCLLGSLVLFYAWLLSAGLTRGLAAVAAALFAIIPGTYIQATFILSESLYLLVVFAGLLALSHAQRSGDARAWWLAMLPVALLPLARSAGVVMLAAAALALWRHRPEGAWRMLFATMLPTLAWSLLHRTDRGYLSALARRMDGDLGTLPGLMGQVAVNASAIGRGIAGNLADPASLQPVVALLCVLAAIVAVRRLIRWQPDAAYALAYLALVVAWPYPGEALRFAWPLMPLLIAYAFLGGAELAAILPPRLQGLRRGVVWAPAAVLALLALPGFIVAAGRYVEAAGYPRPEVRHLAEWYGYNPLVAWEAAEIQLGLVDGVRELSAGVPPGECVYSIKPAIVAQIAGRASYGPPAEALDDAAFERELAARGCRYFLLLASNSPTYRTPYYPQPRLADRLTLLDTRPHPNGSGAVLMALARFEPAR